MQSNLKLLVWKKLFVPLVALGTIFIIAFLGYIFIEGYSPIESLYMLVITITTIGYGEVHPLSDTGRLFTIGFIISGFTVGLYFISKISTFFLDGELSKLLKIRTMNKTLNSFKDHYIVCGYGKTGKKVLEELLHKDYKVVLIENDVERNELLKDLYDKNFVHIVGDATHDEILQHAGVERAKILISVLTSDAENLFVTLSAKDFNKDIKVITRVEDVNSTMKFKKAGADFIISPIEIATDRIISIATKRTDFYSFVEFAGGQDELKSFKFDLVKIKAGSDLIGKSYREANIPQRTNLVVIGFYSSSNDLQVNPKADNIINLGDRLLVFGIDPEINELKTIANYKYFREINE
jgi:voltage-gated potassium channel